VSAVVVPNVQSQAIAGVSPGLEAEITTAYPSLAATGIGQAIGRLFDWLPVKTQGVPWLRLLIVAPLWLIIVPFALTATLTLYGVMKLFGKRYVLTNRSLQVRQLIGLRSFGDAPLADIKDIIIQELPGQAYYKAADLIVKGAGGKTILRLEGVLRPLVFRQTVFEARDSRMQVEESLKTIQSRKHV
jgi:hypothetical protein